MGRRGNDVGGQHDLVVGLLGLATALATVRDHGVVAAAVAVAVAVVRHGGGGRAELSYDEEGR